MTRFDIRALISRGYSDSVARRSFLLLCLIGPAFASNFVLYYLAAKLLSAEGFGLFYIAVTTANVLYSGSFILNMFFTRYLVSIVHTAGEASAYAARNRLRRLVVRWGALGALLCILAVFGLGKWLGVQSWAIVVLVVLDAYSAYIIDVERAFLQSLRKTVLLGSTTLAWMVLRSLFSIAGMVLIGTAWAGLIGVVLAAAFVIAAFVLSPARRQAAVALLIPKLPSLRALVPVILGYVSLIAVSNLDVLLTYMLLKGPALGAYSASSVFPKGILVVVTPLLQMLYPMMVGHEKAPPNIRTIFQKTALVIFLLASALAVGIFAFSGLVCGGSWGLKLCQPVLLQFLLISAVALSLLRALVLYQSARGRDWFALSMLVPAAAYLWIAELSSRTVETVAVQFMIFSGVVLLCYGGLSFFADRK